MKNYYKEVVSNQRVLHRDPHYIASNRQLDGDVFLDICRKFPYLKYIKPSREIVLETMTNMYQ